MKMRSAALAALTVATVTGAMTSEAIGQSSPRRNYVFCSQPSKGYAQMTNSMAQYEASMQKYRECLERARQNGQDVPEPKPACKPGECTAAPR